MYWRRRKQSRSSRCGVWARLARPRWGKGAGEGWGGRWGKRRGGSSRRSIQGGNKKVSKGDLFTTKRKGDEEVRGGVRWREWSSWEREREREREEKEREKLANRKRDAYAHWVGKEVSRGKGWGVEGGERGTNFEEMAEIFTNERKLKHSDCWRISWITPFTRACTHTHTHTHTQNYSCSHTLSLSLPLSRPPPTLYPISPSKNVHVFQTHSISASCSFPPMLMVVQSARITDFRGNSTPGGSQQINQIQIQSFRQ